MAIMKCPKCGGCGEVIEGDPNSTAGTYEVACLNCGGTGYVTDTSRYIQTPPPVSKATVWIKCPHCGEEIEAKEFRGSYIAVKPVRWKEGK